MLYIYALLKEMWIFSGLHLMLCPLYSGIVAYVPATEYIVQSSDAYLSWH